MATEGHLSKLDVKLPNEFPTEAIKYLIVVLTDRSKFDRTRAVKAAYEVVGYLLNWWLSFSGSNSLVALQTAPKPVRRMTNEHTVAALQDVLEKGVDGLAEAFPNWLIFLLIRLIEKWLKS